jgi:hypothetical protein
MAHTDSELSALCVKGTPDFGGVHPVFHATLATFTNQAPLDQIKRDAYVRAVKAQDWSYEFSDDHGAYHRGRESLAQLRLAQRELDPDFVLWNQHCHPWCVNGSSY